MHRFFPVRKFIQIFFQGLIILAPIVITAWAVISLFNFIDGILPNLLRILFPTTPGIEDVYQRRFPGLGFLVVILVVMGVWGLVTSLPWASARWLWLVVGSGAWLAAGYCFPSVGSFNGMLGLFTERRGALVMLFWLLGQGAIYLAWPTPDANWLEPVAKTSTRLGRQPVALVFALICWLSAASFWAMAYWLYVDPILGTAQFPYTHVVLICFLMALAEGLGLVWRYRQLRAYAGYHLLKEAKP